MSVFNRLTEECVNVDVAIRRMSNRDVKLLLKLCSVYLQVHRQFMCKHDTLPVFLAKRETPCHL